MADEEDQVIEGYWRKKGGEVRSLERVLNPADLQEIKAAIATAQSSANSKLQETNQLITSKTTELKTYNDEHSLATSKLKKLREDAKVHLLPAEMKTVKDTVKNTVDELFVRRLGAMAGEAETVEIHVHFFTPEQEGVAIDKGQSKDAIFKVEIESQFKLLAGQVAKYWGLDSAEIFFLDREGRVVPDEMLVKDVVLPDDDIQYMISEWRYTVTVVRAGTDLGLEDPTKVDSNMKDFTFIPDELNDLLEDQRQQLHIKTENRGKGNRLAIPSLQALKTQGELKMRTIKLDISCRTIEVIIFFIVVIAFVILMKPDDRWLREMQRVRLGVSDTLYNDFDYVGESGRERINLATVRSADQFQAFVGGPLREATKSEGWFEKRGLYTIGNVMLRVYREENEECDESLANGTMDGNGTNFTNATVDSNSNNNTNNSNGSNASLLNGPFGLPTYPLQPSCQCKYKSREIFKFIENHPVCVNFVEKTKFRVMQEQWWGLSDSNTAFSVFEGKVSSYWDTEPSYLVTNLDTAAFLAGLNPDPLLDPEVRAIRLLAFVYVTAVEGLVSVSITIEVTAGGMVIPSLNLKILDLRDPSTTDQILYGIVIIASFWMLIAELRRVCCAMSQYEKESASSWLFFHCATPATLLIAFVFRQIAASPDTDELLIALVKRDPDVASQMMELYKYSVMEFYWLVAMLTAMVWINVLFFRYVLSFYKDVPYISSSVVLNPIIKRIFTTMMGLAMIVGMVVSGLAFILYAMWGMTTEEYRTPIRSMLAAISFAHGSFRDHELLMFSYSNWWLVLVLVMYVLLGIIGKNMAVGVLVSHMKEFQLRDNYNYHQFWTHITSDKVALQCNPYSERFYMEGTED